MNNNVIMKKNNDRKGIKIVKETLLFLRGQSVKTTNVYNCIYVNTYSTEHSICFS